MEGRKWSLPRESGRKGMEGNVDALCFALLTQCLKLRMFNSAWHFCLFPVFVGISVLCEA